MALIDDRGRVFGRINIIDAIVGLLVLALIPIAYAGYALFHQPEPHLVAVEPNKVTPLTPHVRITGENLRPFLRVSFNAFQGLSFGLVSPTVAEVRVPQLPPGTYDVILYDVAREITRLPGAVVVEEPPAPDPHSRLLVTGGFELPTGADSTMLTAGLELSAIGGGGMTIVSLGPSVPDARPVLRGTTTIQAPSGGNRQLPALTRTSCVMKEQRCVLAGMAVEPGNTISVFTPDGRAVSFLVRETLPDGPVSDAEVTVRFLLPGDASELPRVGDRDTGSDLLGTRLATIAAVSASRQAAASARWDAPPAAGFDPGSLVVTLPHGAWVIDARLTGTFDDSPDGLSYRGRAVKSGMPFFFETRSYRYQGWILRVDRRATPSSDR